MNVTIDIFLKRHVGLKNPTFLSNASPIYGYSLFLWSLIAEKKVITEKMLKPS